MRSRRRAGALRCGRSCFARPIRRAFGALRGYVDLIGHLIAGWAQNVDHPEAPVCLDIYAGGRLIGQTLANRYRADLERAGLGSGRHSFAFTPPPGCPVPKRWRCAARLTVLCWHVAGQCARPRRAVPLGGRPDPTAGVVNASCGAVFKMPDCVYTDADAIVGTLPTAKPGHQTALILHAEG